LAYEPNTPNTRPTPTWHVDRGIPAALIVTIALQFGIGVWTASQISAQVAVNQRDIQRLQALQENAQEVAIDQAIKLGRIDETLSVISKDLRRIVDDEDPR